MEDRTTANLLAEHHSLVRSMAEASKHTRAGMLLTIDKIDAELDRRRDERLADLADEVPTLQAAMLQAAVLYEFSDDTTRDLFAAAYVVGAMAPHGGDIDPRDAHGWADDMMTERAKRKKARAGK